MSVATDASSDQSADSTTDRGPGPDTGVDAPGHDASPDGAICSGIMTEYAAALKIAQECTLGATNQCALQVRAGFFCSCTTFANSNADGLSAIVTRFQDNGCLNLCAGICTMLRAAGCLADTTSSTGGRCLPTNLVNLNATNNGGTIAVAVGDEVDMTLGSPAPGSYSTTVTLSTDKATILEVTIPAGPTNANGPTRLYRLRATSTGTVQVQIPFEPNASGPSRPSFSVTINIH